MEAAALKTEREYDRATAQAWHTAMFALKGYAGELKGKSLSDYLSNKSSKPKRSTVSDAIAFFHAMKTSGLPVRIERVERKSAE